MNFYKVELEKEVLIKFLKSILIFGLVVIILNQVINLTMVDTSQKMSDVSNLILQNPDATLSDLGLTIADLGITPLVIVMVIVSIILSFVFNLFTEKKTMDVLIAKYYPNGNFGWGRVFKFFVSEILFVTLWVLSYYVIILVSVLLLSLFSIVETSIGIVLIILLGIGIIIYTFFMTFIFILLRVAKVEAVVGEFNGLFSIIPLVFKNFKRYRKRYGIPCVIMALISMLIGTVVEFIGAISIIGIVAGLSIFIRPITQGILAVAIARDMTGNNSELNY